MTSRVCAFLLILSCFSPSDSQASAPVPKPTGVPVPSYDRFPLTTFVEAPAGTSDEEVTKVAVFVHGSGPSDAHGTLNQSSIPGASTVTITRDMAAALRSRGIATIRYHKRAFEIAERLRADPTFSNSDVFRTHADNPFKTYVEDAAFFSGQARVRFPKARVAFVGHSEGTQVALQATRLRPNAVDAVALVGFTNELMSSLMLEQVVHRPLPQFQEADKNSDGRLDAGELSAPSLFAQTLRAQLPILDTNGDGSLQKTELMAASYVKLLDAKNIMSQVSRVAVQQARYPLPVEIVETATFPILFLHGEWDNQTPVYAVKALEFLNRMKWKKESLHFSYFPNAGHGLDPRDNESSVVYKPMEAAALSKFAEDIDALFPRR